MRTPLAEHLSTLLEEGTQADTPSESEFWSIKVAAFLGRTMVDELAEFERKPYNADIWATHARRLGHIQGLIAKAEDEASKASTAIAALAVDPASVQDSRKVFVVHGHDNEAKEATARFLEKLGLQPIILHEQPSSGRTTIEKFEVYAGDISFAIILLTPDDVGATASTPESRKARARQNVIMELGYFMGKLGRTRVCALYKNGVELPSDYQGIVYIEMDSAGAWRAKLAQEFVQAKLPIDLSGLLAG